MTNLVHDLDYIPLAIAQAAAYINQRTSRVSVSRYQETLREGDDQRSKLFRKDIRDPQRDGEASNSVMLIWQLSFEHIHKAHHSALQLLALMSLFDQETIPDGLLRSRYSVVSDGEEESSEVDFEDDVATLRAYHLINPGAN